MKTSSIVGALLASIIVSAHAQNAGGPVGGSQIDVPAPTAYREIERGANHRVWQRETYERSPSGEVVPHIHKYTELASGLNYQDANGQWQESKEEIESYPGGAIARHGQYQVIFANNLNSYGAIDMQTPDGKRLRSNILGLMYHDTATDEAVLIASLQDSKGELISSNQVLYLNAFDGLMADVQYTYRKGSFEQDVILREQPPTPESFGLNPDTTEIEVMTEFINPPEASVQDEKSSGRSLEPDQEIGWGEVKLGHGKAFQLGERTSKVPVSKRYTTVKGRHFLLEKVLVKEIEADVARLPEQAAIGTKLPVTALKDMTWPKTPNGRAGGSPMRMAVTTPSDSGYVLDYTTISSSLTNYTFQGDTTYYISGTVNLYGTTVLEGGTVLKYASGSVILYGPLTCQTEPYRPAVFTAKDDNTVGETISGSTGNPNGYYAGNALSFSLSSSPVYLHDVRISYAQTGVYGSTPTNLVRDAVFNQVGTVFNCGNGTWWLENVLACQVTSSVMQGYYPIFRGTFLTLDHINQLIGSSYHANIYLTNSLITAFTNYPSASYPNTLSIAYTSIIAGSGVYQTVGAGSHYLAANSPYRNTGTTNIDSTLLADLAAKTTYPPVVYSNTIVSVDTTLNPQAQRDTDVPDLGYHYNPLDYLMDYYQITNATLTISNGTAIGCYLDNPGIWLQDGSSISACGTPTQPIQITFYNTVQEQPVFLSSLAQSNFVYACQINPYHTGVTQTSAATGVFDFVKFTGLTHSGVPFYHGRANWDFRSLQVKNCEIDTMYGYTTVSVESNTTTSFFNNCFRRVSINCLGNSGAEFTFSNNLFLASPSLSLRTYGGIIAFFNNAVDSCHLVSGTLLGGYITNDYNAYFGCSGAVPFSNVGTHNIVLTNSLGYLTGLLGDFYQPTNSPLINQGSTTADQVGLYHFTTQTNQTKETSSIVDIGYHYVAVDGNGNPTDSDGDENPDYLEDSNGNGITDGSETQWAVAPGISVQPASQTANAGDMVGFSVTATGTSPLNYQWYLNNTNLLVGATNSYLFFSSVQVTNTGNYRVVVSNMAGDVTSSNAVLTVNAGTVVAWGSQSDGQTDVPVDLTNVTAIAAGGYHTVALKGDGTVVVWGRYNDGETDVPAGLTNVTAIAAGEYHTVALKRNGTVVAWGYNSDGETDVPVGLTNVTAVTAGGYHALALKSDGTVVAWGADWYGETDVPAGLTNVTAIAAGGYHTVALKSDGTVVAWGNNDYGQTDVPVGLTNVTAVAAGEYFTMALKSDSVVVAWGFNYDGETDVPDGLEYVAAIAAGGYHVAVLGVLPPSIVSQPTDATLDAGLSATFSVVASGTTPLTYQWRFNGINIPGANDSSYTWTIEQSYRVGSFSVVVSNAYGSVTSNDVKLVDSDGDGLPDNLDADNYSPDTSAPAFVITSPDDGATF